MIHNGVDPDMMNRPMLSERIFPQPYILAVGHIEKRKNLSMLVSAFGMISDRWNGSLVLAGKESHLVQEIRAIAAEGRIADRVYFTGSVSDVVMRILLRDCEILACPSLYEGFGMTLLEGMAMNKPVVASRIPAHEEVGGHGVLFVDTGGEMTVNFANALISLIENSSLQNQFISSGNERKRAFSWDSASEKLSTLYRSLAEQRHEE